MTSFNIESEFLDLKKTYQNFEYLNLTTEDVITSQEVAGIQEIYEGMTQNTYLFVQEKTTLTKDIQNMSIYFIHKHCEKNATVKEEAFLKFPFEKVRDRVCFIFQKYQEQPCLLDTLLEALIQPIMDAVKRYLSRLLKQNYESAPTEDLHSMLQIIYQLTKVRGKKWVIQYFPHEVKDLYPAIGYLVKERTDQNSNWETRYVILLWLGVIALVPFNLDIIDSEVVTMPKEDGTVATEIVDLMLEIGKHYLRSLTKMREASGLFLGKLFTRPDIQKRGILPQYVDYVLKKLDEIKQSPMQNFFVCGLYNSLKQIFKRVQRNELLPLITPILNHLQKQKEAIKDTGSKKELKMKLLTQIGLTYLKPRIAAWAFKKKKQSLLTNLAKNIKETKIQTNTSSFQNKESKNFGEEITEENDVVYYQDVNKSNLEEVIDLLIEGLSEKETPVREKASKGLGKIAGRLSQDMVMDIIDYILNLTPNPQTQHAICLTIAEFIRRNLISPEKLNEMYQLMKDSLLYEIQEGGYSIGQAVRDAACYMTWSVARAYEQGGYQLGISLMIAACFDRQVGCRRAASAAFQQLVGRVGDVPNGIEVLTEADYFTLGVQKNAYLNIAIFVASYEPYFKPFIEHLCYQKLRHWDLQIKRIAACSLSLMCPLNPSFVAKEVLPALAHYLKADSMNTRLGTLIGIGEILLGLKGLSNTHQLQNQMKDSVFLKSLTQNEQKLMKAGEYMSHFKRKYEQIQHQDHFKLISPEVLQDIANILEARIIQGKMYKGKSGENFRIYTCRVLECFALCNLPLSDKHIACFTNFIEQNIRHTLEPIIKSAVKCLKPFLTVYHDVERDKKFIDNIITSSRSSSKTTALYSKGYTHALSKLNKAIYIHHFEELINAFEYNCRLTRDNDDPEKRRYAIMGIQALVEEVGFNSEVLREAEIKRIFTILFSTLNDYTMDKRGDIGSIVREASMSSLLEIIKKYCSEKERRWKISDELVTRMIGHLLQQLSQKIDRIRLLSGSILQNFFDYYSNMFDIPDQKHLMAVFCQANIKKLIKESESKIDSNLQTDVIRMEMKIQETIFHETERYLIYFWNLPHSVYPIVVPFLESEAYSLFILRGLCTSTGGISESIIKYSLQELGNYITYIFTKGREDLMGRLLHEIIMILKDQWKEDRVIIPMYKTLDYILQRSEVIGWEGLRKFDIDLYSIIQREVSRTKSIVKVSASTGLYVSLLILNNPETKNSILESIVKILCSDLPKARKVLSDKLLFFLMSQDDYLIFSEEASQELMNILSENDFLDEKLDVESLKPEIRSFMGL